MSNCGCAYIGLQWDQSKVEEMFREADLNRDGVVSFEELYRCYIHFPSCFFYESSLTTN